MDELKMSGNNLVEKLISYALRRKEKLVVISASDILCFNKSHRMNEPGNGNQVNWTFKLINFDKLKKTLPRFF